MWRSAPAADGRTWCDTVLEGGRLFCVRPKCVCPLSGFATPLLLGPAPMPDVCVEGNGGMMRASLPVR